MKKIINSVWTLSLAALLSFLSPESYGNEGKNSTVNPNSNAPSKRVSIALIVTPSNAQGKAWDLGFGADLILCGAKGCYVSHGLGQAATFHQGSRALRLLKKAGQCRDVLKCLFRDIDLTELNDPDHYAVQPVDVDYLSHEYLPASDLSADKSCAMKQGVIHCGQGVHKTNYSLWVIPEKLAKKAGREGLDYVLYKSLQADRDRYIANRLTELRDRLPVKIGLFYQHLLGIKPPQKCLADPVVLTESYFLSGLADSRERRSEIVLRDLVGAKPVSNLANLIRRRPEIFWAFLDMTDRLLTYAQADKSRMVDDKGLKMVKRQDQNVLHYDWKIKARAKSTITACAGEDYFLPL